MMVEVMANGKRLVGWVQDCKTSIMVGEEVMCKKRQGLKSANLFILFIQDTTAFPFSYHVVCTFG